MFGLKATLFLFFSLATHAIAGVLMVVPYPKEKGKAREVNQKKESRGFALPSDAIAHPEARIVRDIKQWSKGKYNAQWLAHEQGMPKTIIVYPNGKTITKVEEAEDYFKAIAQLIDAKLPRRPKTPQRRWPQMKKAAQKNSQMFAELDDIVKSARNGKRRNKRTLAALNRRNHRQ